MRFLRDLSAPLPVNGKKFRSRSDWSRVPFGIA